MELRFNNIPSDWKDGLLVGNGRLHAVVWGDGYSDRISLNHEHLWTGDHGERANQSRQEFLPSVRQFLKEKDYYRATVLTSMAFSGDGGCSPYPRREDMYKPAGDLVFLHQEKQGDEITRTLDMQCGIARTERNRGSSEVFADCVNGLLGVRWESEHKLDGMLQFQQEAYKNRMTVSDTEIRYHAVIDQVCSYEVVTEVVTDGAVLKSKEGLLIQGASYIECWINIGVSYDGISQELSAFQRPTGLWNEIEQVHSARFRKEMGKTSIHIADDDTKQCQQMSVNERVARVRGGAEDTNLMALYAEFGKYLLLSGSICAKLPLNLQGKWNCDQVPPWNCDYHFNINIQMNYWFAEQLDLSECTAPLFRYVNSFAESGKEAARLLYGCRGTWLSLNGDHWAVSTPEAYNYAAWIGGAAWIAQHYWWHYLYGGDRDFLREQAYPLFKNTARFYMDYIEIDENGVAQLAPSQSPENCFQGTGEFPVSFCISSAMDVQLAYDAFTYAIQAAAWLGEDEKERKEWEKLKQRLPKFGIGADGRLLEWDDEGKIEVEKGHRHYSHLYGLFPSELFQPELRQEQYEAAGKSLDYRLSQNGGGTGWSRAWGACLYSRLRNGDKAYEQLRYLLTELSSPALLDLHPKPARCKVRNEASDFVFQIDGNMGGVRAIIECLIQSYGGSVYLLPALPGAWKTGGVTGIKTQGGHKVSFSYAEGVITYLEVVMGFEETMVLDNQMGLLPGKEKIVLQGSEGTKIRLI